MVLIRPLYETKHYDPEIQEALGIESLAAYLRAYGHHVLLLDPLQSGQSEDRTIKRAVSFAPQLVGFSIMSGGDLSSTQRMMAGIKMGLPQIQWAAGGNLVSTEPEYAAASLPAGTACLRYEGEIPLLSLLDAISSGRSLDTVPSMIMKMANGVLMRTENAPVIENLDALPFPVRDHFQRLDRRALTANIQGSRGCCGSCRYCCAPGWPRAVGSRWRGHSPYYLADEIQSLAAQTGVRFFNFIDDDFLGPDFMAPSRASQFRDEIEKRGLRIAFGIQARPSTLTPEVIQCLSEAGLCHVFLGIESNDRQVLARWGKSHASLDIEAVIVNLRSFGIEVQAGYIPFHKYATPASIKRQAQYLDGLGLLNYRTATNRMLLLPGSVMHREVIGISNVDDLISGPLLEDLDENVNILYNGLIKILEPLRVVWVFAATVLPTVQAQARLARNQEINRAYKHREALLEVLDNLNRYIKEVLFSLLGQMEMGGRLLLNEDPLYEKSLELAMHGTKALWQIGLLESPEVLHKAILKDCRI
ncbi:MAG TPA: cobalamin-dependent protein [Syntrophomonadaceae bacterium]|nr:cobalamin-dependent protein [Syntrophomonadaceae bacterium]